ncbi:hypothetical protein EIN_369800 [Entamoeba invadens IP1]|uniref:Uncharacterized protein n=1 Tax=Entamoeba invadens IP1 TaxID=370355 RepID=A0A0A1UBX8_ENTIV|nr:hypothetical protein EIN_369800 [Entamoeba invadens IP1]ELP92658.1 hypothetical protein EIN_369800 [Entamoeba invadens IP1]|eukprot:XP_004259429.1 hypothetical protein EIN_369800 [Entamoeba invadens IP1]
MGNGTSKSVNDIIETFATEKNINLKDVISSLTIEFTDNDRIKLFESATQDVSPIFNVTKYLIDNFTQSVSNEIFMLEVLLPLCMRHCSSETITSLVSKLFYKIYPPDQSTQHLLLVAMSSPLYGKDQVDIKLSASDLSQAFIYFLRHSEFSTVFLTLALRNERNLEGFCEVMRSKNIGEVFESYLQIPLSVLSIPLFFILIDISPPKVQILLDNLALGNTNNYLCVLPVLQALIITTQKEFVPPCFFNVLLPLLLPPNPPAVSDAVCGALYNASLFVTEISTHESEIVVQKLILSSSPDVLSSTSWRVLRMLGRIIHRLLHNKNYNMLFALLKEEKEIHQITEINSKQLKLPQSVKEWSDHELENYIEESKIFKIDEYLKRISTVVVKSDDFEKKMLMCRMTDDVETSQLEPNGKALEAWGWDVYKRELSERYGNVFWNGFK